MNDDNDDERYINICYSFIILKIFLYPAYLFG